MAAFILSVILFEGQLWAACDYSKIPAFAAAYKGDVKAIERGNYTRSDINQKFPDGACKDWTPIIIAAAEGHLEMVKLLIAKGADVNAKNAFGRTALMFASKYGFLDIVKALLQARADPNIRPKEGPIAIIAAGDEGKAQVIRELLHNGATVSLRDCQNQYEKDSCVRIAYVMSVLMNDFERSTHLITPLCSDNHYDRKKFACDVLKANECLRTGGTRESCMYLFDAALGKSKPPAP
jgi:hypothetical protein